MHPVDKTALAFGLCACAEKIEFLKRAGGMGSLVGDAARGIGSVFRGSALGNIVRNAAPALHEAGAIPGSWWRQMVPHVPGEVLTDASTLNSYAQRLLPRSSLSPTYVKSWFENQAHAAAAPEGWLAHAGEELKNLFARAEPSVEEVARSRMVGRPSLSPTYVNSYLSNLAETAPK